MKYSIYLLAIFALVFTACGNEKSAAKNETSATKTHQEAEHNHADHDHGNMANHEDREVTASTKKNVATSEIVDAYIQIKNGLVATDKNLAAKGGEALLAAFSAFDMSQLSGETHKEYMEILESAKEQAEHIIKNPVDHQREHFEVLSTDINDLITLLGTNKTLYQDFCPMANNGKGAIWLSEIEEIKNPFYGSKMMKCGKVQKQIN